MNGEYSMNNLNGYYNDGGHEYEYNDHKHQSDYPPIAMLFIIIFCSLSLNLFRCLITEDDQEEQLNIPLIVHSRNAESDTIDILKSEKKNSNLKILIHCFTGSKQFASKLIDIDCYISVSGIITFKNSSDLCDTVSTIPLENLLVETDSPYLAPSPYRGKPNEPSYIIHTIDKLSELKKIPRDKVIEYTTANFKRLFQVL